LLRLGVRALPLLPLFASDIDFFARLETSSFRTSTASPAAPGSAWLTSALLPSLSIWSARDVALALPAEIEKR
jgi:hypothetical protein